MSGYDINKSMTEMNRELARQNAIKVLKMSYTEGIISKEEYRVNLKTMYKTYFKG